MFSVRKHTHTQKKTMCVWTDYNKHKEIVKITGIYGLNKKWDTKTEIITLQMLALSFNMFI